MDGESVKDESYGYKHNPPVRSFCFFCRQPETSANPFMVGQVCETCFGLLALDMGVDLAIIQVLAFSLQIDLFELTIKGALKGYQLEDDRVVGLKLRQLELQEVPEPIKFLSHLQWLDLSQNKLTRIPDLLPRLGSLERLLVSENEINDLKRLGNIIGSVKLLDLSGNGLENVEFEGGQQVIPITHLDLSKNQIQSIAAAFFDHLPFLTHLKLEHNPLIEFAMPDKKPTIRSLNLSHTNLQLEVIREEALHHLSELFWRGNGLWQRHLTPLEGLVNLKILDLSKNHLKSFNCSISNLEELIISQNQISEFPLVPPCLKRLNLSDNKLTEWTESFPACFVESFVLDNNNFSYLPDWLWGLTQLLELRLSSNNISHLSPLINQLHQLKVLDLSHNNLESLPNEVFELKHIATLRLTGNPLRRLFSLRQMGVFIFQRELSFKARLEVLTKLQVTHPNKWKIRPVEPGIRHKRILKCLKLGDEESGKKYFFEERISPVQQTSGTVIGLIVASVDLQLPFQNLSWEKIRISMHNVNAADRFVTIRHLFYPGAHLALLFYNVAKPHSLSNIHAVWNHELETYTTRSRDPPIIKVLVGFRESEDHPILVEESEAEEMMEQLGCVGHVMVDRDSQEELFNVLQLMSFLFLQQALERN